jgi:hypothetical protein
MIFIITNYADAYMRISTATSQASAGFLIGLLFDPEDGCSMFLRNFRLCPKYMTLQPGRPRSL